MSLVQHVTATEGTDREPLFSDFGETGSRRGSISSHHGSAYHYGTIGSTKSVRRVLSYDVFPPAQPPVVEETKGAVNAYQVSTARRIAQVITVTLACWFASGIVFGFAALKPVFIRERVWRELCTEEELAENVEVCYRQDLNLNFFFSLASTTTNVSALVVGFLLDRYGSRNCNLAGAVFLAIGTILMGSSFANPALEGYTVANFFLALGGTFIFVPSFQVANAFPKYAGTIVALITGAFDASAAVFLFYRLAYESSHGTFSPDKFFYAYIAVPVVIFIAQGILLPRHEYNTAPQLEQQIINTQDASRDVHDSDEEIDSAAELRRRRRRRSEVREAKRRRLEDVFGDAEERRQREREEEKRQAASGVWGALHSLPAHVQMRTPWFILITLLTILQMVRMNYFISTIRNQYEYMLGSRQLAEEINDFFDIALPVGGIAATPFLGPLLDNLSTTSVLAILVSLITTVGVLNALPYVWAGYATVVVFCALRPLYYSAMSDYATKVFGFATFGRVYGTIVCLSGLANLSQSGIQTATYLVFDGNPTPVNIILGVLGTIVGMVLVVYVAVQSRRVKQRLAEEDFDASASVMESVIEEDESIY